MIENSQMIYIIMSLTVGYLLGSISPSFLIGKWKGYDVREQGTGNAGASNTVIMAGNFAGAVVAIVDVLKSAVASLLCKALFPFFLAGVLGGIAAILGHMFPIFLGFRGGKGLACIAGVILACEPMALIPLFILSMLICFLLKSPSLVAPVISIVWPLYHGHSTGLWMEAAILAIPILPIFIKHMPNFRRIAEGEDLPMRFLWNKDEEIRRLQKK